jgi:hypothetical protein
MATFPAQRANNMMSKDEFRIHKEYLAFKTTKSTTHNAKKNQTKQKEENTPKRES